MPIGNRQLAIKRQSEIGNQDGNRQSLRAWDCEVAFFGAHEQLWQTARWRDFDLHLVPLAIVGEVVWLIADRVLVAEFEGNLFKNVVHLDRRARKEGLAA